jgi:hypothetical protein
MKETGTSFQEVTNAYDSRFETGHGLEEVNYDGKTFLLHNTGNFFVLFDAHLRAKQNLPARNILEQAFTTEYEGDPVQGKLLNELELRDSDTFGKMLEIARQREVQYKAKEQIRELGEAQQEVPQILYDLAETSDKHRALRAIYFSQGFVKSAEIALELAPNYTVAHLCR